MGLVDVEGEGGDRLLDRRGHVQQVRVRVEGQRDGTTLGDLGGQEKGRGQKGDED